MVLVRPVKEMLVELVVDPLLKIKSQEEAVAEAVQENLQYSVHDPVLVVRVLQIP